MDSQILASERAAHQQSKKRARTILWSVTGGVTALLCLMMLVPLATIDLRIAVFSVLIMFVVLAGSIGLSFLLSKAINQSTATPYGPASPGPWSFGQVYTPLPPEQVWPAIRYAALAQNLAATWVGPTTTQFTKQMGWATAGAHFLVDLRPSVDRPGMGVVTIAAHPRLAYVQHDMGIAQNTVNALLTAVPSHQLPGQPSVTAPMLTQRPTGPQDRHHS